MHKECLLYVMLSIHNFKRKYKVITNNLLQVLLRSIIGIDSFTFVTALRILIVEYLPD